MKIRRSTTSLNVFAAARPGLTRALLLTVFTCLPGQTVCGQAEVSGPLVRQPIRRLASGSRNLLGVASRLSASVRASDIDGDGDADLVVANGRHWPQQNMLFVNDGRGRMTVARPLGVDLCTSYACEFADLDGDGDADLAVGNDMAACLIFLNDGTGQFRRHATFGAPSSVRSLTTVDIDADGDIDLLTTCRGRANQIALNNGRAEFTESISFGTSEDSTIDVAAADLNEDGLPDLILANRDAQPNTILLGLGQGTFTDPVPFGGPRSSSRAVATADFDGDGHIDWVVGNIGAANVLYLGDGTGGVRREIRLNHPAGRTYCLAIADMNGDGRPDVICGNAGQANMVYFSAGDPLTFVTAAFGESDSVTYGLCVADINGDGTPDVAVANSDQQNRVFLNLPGEGLRR